MSPCVRLWSCLCRCLLSYEKENKAAEDARRAEAKKQLKDSGNATDPVLTASDAGAVPASHPPPPSHPTHPPVCVGVVLRPP